MNHSNVAGALVGKNAESESEQSLTSPFDVGIFSSVSFKHLSETDGRYQKRWNSCKVGLSLVYSLAAADGVDGETNGTRKAVHSYCLKIAPTSVIEEPKPADGDDGETIGTGKVVHSYYLKVFPATVTEEPKPANVIFKIGKPVYVPEMHLHSRGPEFVGSLLFNEIEVYEDYTHVIVHGPSSKVTHIFGDLVLGQANSFLTYFLKNCYACQKEMDGEDVYMYSEKAFCSNNCRSREIEMDEEMEKNKDNDCFSETSDMSNNSDELIT